MTSKEFDFMLDLLLEIAKEEELEESKRLNKIIKLLENARGE